MLKKSNFAATAGAIALGLCTVATAALAAEGEGPAVPVRDAKTAQIDLLEREGQELNRAIDAARTEDLSNRYRELYAQARKLDAEPKANLLAERGEPKLSELTDEVGDLRDDVEKAKRSDAAGGDFALVGGVSQATLDAIASCESGGDPTAVNAAGYYGKYQFDEGTWASVGGSGNPAEAPEAEQDIRAAHALPARRSAPGRSAASRARPEAKAAPGGLT